ncbi:hypothetical protein T492DRAFT_898764 [Pavlovales sp. CCMP2436]|nr:hypothetical protein T492DRAFT_898764 [Pavlovales sp. CCMP2436]
MMSSSPRVSVKLSLLVLLSACGSTHAMARPLTHRVSAVRAAGFGETKSKERRPAPQTPCGCGSGTAYRDCCARLHDDGGPATEVPALIRARFTAYEYRLPDFLLSSKYTVGAKDTKEVRKELESYMVSSYMARTSDLFKQYSQVMKDRVVTFNERSAFVKGADGGWRYSEAGSTQSYEGEQGYDQEGAKQRFHAEIAEKRAKGERLTNREVVYAQEHNL